MFDPYHKWLGIPPGNRPPTHYQLLGIAPTEIDLEVIEEAFIRQTTHLRTYQNGPQALECTKLLNELAQAHVVLTNPAKRKQYNTDLEEQRLYQVRSKMKPFQAPLAEEKAPVQTEAPKARKVKRTHYYPEPRRKQKSPVVAIVVSIAVTAAVILGAVFLLSGGEKPTNEELAARNTGKRDTLQARRPTQPSVPESNESTDAKPPSPPPEEESRPSKPPTPPPTKTEEEESRPAKPSPPPTKRDDPPPPTKKEDEGVVELTKVDLLKLITPLNSRYVVKGTWRFVGKTLVSPLDQFARVQIPYVPPEEYDLRIVVERKQGPDCMVIGFPLPNLRTFINIDAGSTVGYYSGLQGIDGLPMVARNEGRVTGPLIVKGKNTIVCKVRKQELTITVNGRVIVHFTGDYQRLVAGGDWEVPMQQVFILASWKSSYHFSVVELTPISGPGKVLE